MEVRLWPFFWVFVSHILLDSNEWQELYLSATATTLSCLVIAVGLTSAIIIIIKLAQIISHYGKQFIFGNSFTQSRWSNLKYNYYRTWLFRGSTKSKLNVDFLPRHWPFTHVSWCATWVICGEYLKSFCSFWWFLMRFKHSLAWWFVSFGMNNRRNFCVTYSNHVDGTILWPILGAK